MDSLHCRDERYYLLLLHEGLIFLVREVHACCVCVSQIFRRVIFWAISISWKIMSSLGGCLCSAPTSVRDRKL